jgi:hypothetical protein
MVIHTLLLTLALSGGRRPGSAASSPTATAAEYGAA